MFNRKCIIWFWSSYLLKELQEMILEADIDGDGQVKQFQFYFSHQNHSLVYSVY